MFKKSILRCSLLSLSIGLSGCGDSIATIDQHNLDIISQSSAFSENEIIEFREKLALCQKDEFCQSKITYALYDNAFVTENFSQIGTAINYMKWVNNIENHTVTMESQRLSINWGKLFRGTFMCLNNEKCTQWLIDSNNATEIDIQSLKALGQ